jgi:hypothetical protein
MPTSSQPAGAVEPAETTGQKRLVVLRVSSPFSSIDSLLKRDEADILFIAGNLALVALELIEWPVAALTIALHAMSRSRFKALRVVAEVAEEAE